MHGKLTSAVSDLPNVRPTKKARHLSAPRQLGRNATGNGGYSLSRMSFKSLIAPSTSARLSCNI